MNEIKTNALDELYKRIDKVNLVSFHPIKFKIETIYFVREWRKFALNVKLEYENNKIFSTTREAEKYLKRFKSVMERFNDSIKNMVFLEDKYKHDKLDENFIVLTAFEIYENADTGTIPDYSDFIILLLDRFNAVQEMVLYDQESIRYYSLKREEEIFLSISIPDNVKLPPDTLQSVTDEEFNILKMIQKGMTQYAISKQLGITEKTLNRNFLKPLREKFGVTRTKHALKAYMTNTKKPTG